MKSLCLPHCMVTTVGDAEIFEGEIRILPQVEIHLSCLSKDVKSYLNYQGLRNYFHDII